MPETLNFEDEKDFGFDLILYVIFPFFWQVMNSNNTSTRNSKHTHNHKSYYAMQKKLQVPIKLVI